MPTDWSAIVPLITQGVSTAGQIAAARQAGREKQAASQVPVDQINQSAYATDLSAKQRGLESKDAALLARAVGMLQEQAAARKAPGERATTSVRGDILANAQDSTFSGSSRIPKFSFDGGLRPSMFSDNTRKLGGEMSRAALMDQMAGEDTPFADLPAADFSSVIDSKGPGATPLPEGSRLDSILGAINQIGALGVPAAAGIMEARKPAAPIPAPQVTPGVPAGLFGGVLPPAPPPVPQPMLAGRNVVGNTAPARTY
jgi:hypothetical protein